MVSYKLITNLHTNHVHKIINSSASDNIILAGIDNNTNDANKNHVSISSAVKNTIYFQ